MLDPQLYHLCARALFCFWFFSKPLSVQITLLLPSQPRRSFLVHSCAFQFPRNPIIENFLHSDSVNIEKSDFSPPKNYLNEIELAQPALNDLVTFFCVTRMAVTALNSVGIQEGPSKATILRSWTHGTQIKNSITILQQCCRRSERRSDPSFPSVRKIKICYGVCGVFFYAPFDG